MVRQQSQTVALTQALFDLFGNLGRDLLHRNVQSAESKFPVQHNIRVLLIEARQHFNEILFLEDELQPWVFRMHRATLSNLFRRRINTASDTVRKISSSAAPVRDECLDCAQPAKIGFAAVAPQGLPFIPHGRFFLLRFKKLQDQPLSNFSHCVARKVIYSQ